jgi:hypothetical protein
VAPDINSKKKGLGPLVWILSLVSLVLAILLVWQSTQPRPAERVLIPTPTEPTVVANHHRNPAEQQLMDSLTQSTNTLVLDTSVFKSPILISDSIAINKDTFFLFGNGLVLRGDSAMKTVGLLLPQNANYVVLSDIVFEHFPTAIRSSCKSLRLRNVRFRDCGVAVSYAFHTPEMQFVNGIINEDIPFDSDSLPDKNIRTWK